MCPKVDLQASYRKLQVTSAEMTSLPGHFPSRGHMLSRDRHLRRVTALYELKGTQNLTNRLSTATSR